MRAFFTLEFSERGRVGSFVFIFSFLEGLKNNIGGDGEVVGVEERGDGELSGPAKSTTEPPAAFPSKNEGRCSHSPLSFNTSK